MWWQRRVLQRTKLGCTRGMLVPPTNYMHPSPTRFAHALHPLRWALLVRWLLQRLSSLLRSQNAQRRQAHLMCHGFAMCSLRMLAPLRAVRPLSEGPRCSAALPASSNAACGVWRFSLNWPASFSPRGLAFEQQATRQSARSPASPSFRPLQQGPLCLAHCYPRTLPRAEEWASSRKQNPTLRSGLWHRRAWGPCCRSDRAG